MEGVAQQLRGRFVARDSEQKEKTQDFVVTQFPPDDLGCHQGSEQIFYGFLAPTIDVGLGVLEKIQRGLDCTRRHLGYPFFPVQYIIDPVSHLVSILPGHTDHLADEVHR